MNQSLKKVIIPTLGQSLASILVSMLLFLALYRDLFWQRLVSGSLGRAISQVNYGDELSSLTQSPIVHTLVIVGFWSAVGLVAYTIVWSLINVLIEARNEVVLETEYTNKSAFYDRVRVPMTQLALAIVLFVGLYLTAKLTFPFWLSLVYLALTAQSLGVMLLYLLLATLGAAINIYAILLLAQLVFWVG
jgi:hypothetical protein